MIDTPAPYVRLIEHVFRAVLTDADDSSGEWRYAWTEQRFDVGDGTYSDAVPPRLGTTTINYATELRGSLVPLDRLYWILLKGAVAGQLVYEVLDCCSGATYLSSTSVTWTTQQDDLVFPSGISTIVVTLTSGDVSLTGVVLQDNQTGTIVNGASSTYSLLILDRSTSSLIGNRITTGTTQTIVVQPGGSITLWRDPGGPVGGPTVATTTNVVPGPKPAPQTATLTTNQNDYQLSPGVDTIALTVTSADVDLTGIVPADRSMTQTQTIINDPASTKLITLKQDAASTTGNRFDFPDGADLVLRPGTSTTITRTTGVTTKWKTTGTTTQKPWVPTISGTTNNLPLTTGRFPDALIPILGAAATLTGFPASFPVGVPLTISNPSSNSDNLTIANAAGTSAVGFTTSTGADLVLTPGKSVIVISDGATISDVGGSLSLATGTASPFTRTKYTLSYTDLSYAGFSHNFTVVALPAGTVLLWAAAVLTTQFSGGTVATLTIGLQTAKGPLAVSPLNGAQAPSGSTFTDTASASSGLGLQDVSSSANVQVAVTASGDTLDHLTAGSVDVYLWTTTLS